MSADVTVVGSGPNGLAAAYEFAAAGLKVRVIERNSTLGGGLRTSSLIETGFIHDHCSAVHPMALASPFFSSFGLTDRVEMVVPELSYAHPIAPGRSGLAWRDLERTAAGLGRDGRSWRRMFAGLRDRLGALSEISFGAVGNTRPSTHHLAYGIRALQATYGRLFADMPDGTGRAMLSGLAAHTMGNAGQLSGALVGLVLGTHAHAGGWAIPVGGSSAIADALVLDLQRRGVEFVTDREVTSLDEVADSDIVMLDVSIPSFVKLAQPHSAGPGWTRYHSYARGTGVAKVDFTLDEPVPWADPELAAAGTLHLGGAAEEVVTAERHAVAGRSPRPFVMVSQPSRFDPTRAPRGKHVLWAYAHVPNGSTTDYTEAVVSAIERFAPGFRDVIRGSAHRSAMEMEDYNPNYVGGDIGAGATSLLQLLRRPRLRNPWATPLPGVYLCSSATAPGAGVHGMCGSHAARLAARRELRMDLSEFV